MIVEVDTVGSTARLADYDVFTSFKVVSSTLDDGAVGRAMGPAGSAAGDAHVWVNVDWIRQQAGDRATADWSAEFAGMLDYAASKAWMNETRTAIRAHIDVVGEERKT